MNKRNFLKYLLSTFPMLHLNQLHAGNVKLIQRKIPKDQKNSCYWPWHIRWFQYR